MGLHWILCETITNRFYIKIETTKLWSAHETFLETAKEKHRMEGITSRKFHFSLQRICQVTQNTEYYENAILYSTKERIAVNDNDYYVFNFEKLIFFWRTMKQNLLMIEKEN